MEWSSGIGRFARFALPLRGEVQCLVKEGLLVEATSACEVRISLCDFTVLMMIGTILEVSLVIRASKLILDILLGMVAVDGCCL